MPAVLFAAAAYELALLLWGSYGSVSGAGIEGEEAVAAVAYLTMLTGAVVAGVHSLLPRAAWAVALFAPAAAGFMTARFYTYDPYYLPALRRYSDDGAGSAEWILGMLFTAIVVGAVTRLLPRAGSVATACLLPVILFTSVLASAGH